MKRLIIKNQSGLGLIPFLITTFVVGLIIAGISSSVVTMLRSQLSVAASAEASLLSEQLQATLSNEGSCANALSGKVPDGSALTNVPVRIGDQDAVLSENADLPAGQGFKLVTFKLNIDDAPFVGSSGTPTIGVPTFKDGADPVTSHRVKVSLQLRKTNEGIFSPVSQIKEFYIDANIKADNSIKSCAARSVASQSCFQMGGVWNTSVENDVSTGLPVDGNRCMSNQFCQYGGSYAGFANPAQASFPNTFVTPPDYRCPDGFSAKQTGAVALANAVSKSEIQTTVGPIYSCLRCVQTDLAPVISGSFNSDLGLALANSSISAALAEGDGFYTTGAVLLATTCNNALRTSGDWYPPSYSQSDCGTIPAPPNPCDPRAPAYSRSTPCTLYYDDGMGGWIPYTAYSAYSTTCHQVRALPAACTP